MKNIKFKILLLAVVSLLVSNDLFAQKNNKSYYRHDLQLQAGFLPLYARIAHSQVNPLDLNKGSNVHIPSLNLAYTYKFNSWFAAGAVFSYTGVSRNDYDNIDGSMLLKSRDHYISFTPTVRFDWLRRDIVRLYSSVGVGVCYNMDNEDVLVGPNSGKSSYSDIYASFDVTPLGIAVGRKVYGLCEFGFGTNGIIKVGVGYKFCYKK